MLVSYHYKVRVYKNDRACRYYLTSHIWKVAKKQSKEKVEYNQVSDEHCWQKIGNASRACNIHAIPHRLNPLATKHTEYNHYAEK